MRVGTRMLVWTLAAVVGGWVAAWSLLAEAGDPDCRIGSVTAGCGTLEWGLYLLLFIVLPALLVLVAARLVLSMRADWSRPPEERDEEDEA